MGGPCRARRLSSPRAFLWPMIILKNHISKDETISFSIIIISLYLIPPAHASHETGKISHVSHHPHHLHQRYPAARQRRAAVARQARRHALAAAGRVGNRLAQRRAAGPDTGGAVADFHHARR